jgi:adenylate cyclase class IV
MFKITQEIELRGPMNQRQYLKLLNFLKKNGEFVEHRNRVNYMFDHPNKQVDVRVRSTNDDIEMIMKLGHIGAHRRKEISFKLGKIKLKDAIDFLYHLGYKKGLAGTRISDIFMYDGIEFAVVHVPGRAGYHEHYFEMETQAKSAAGVNNAKAHMKRLADKLGLRFFGKKEYDQYLVDMNNYASERFSLKD